LLGTTLRVPEFQVCFQTTGCKIMYNLTGKSPARLLVIPIKPNALICALTQFRKQRVPMCKGRVLTLCVAAQETRQQLNGQ